MPGRIDPWLTALAAGPSAKLLKALPDATFPQLERRFLALTALPRDEAIADAVVRFFSAFPVRFREQLATAAAATGAAWVHRPPASAFEKVRSPKAPNTQVAPWHQAICRALAAALGERAQGEANVAGFDDGPSTHVLERSISLLAFSPDPRIADAAAAFIARPSVRWSAEVPVFTALALLLSVHGDRSHRAAAKELATQLPSLAWVEAALPDRAPAPRPPPKKNLLDTIAAAPHDDGPRAVLTDALLERGDPRGEFMALQRSGANPKRAAALQKKHEKQWLGSLARGVVKGSAVFRDGVLRAVRIAAWRGAELPALDAPELATLEEVELEGGTNLPLPALLADASRWRSLKALTAKPWVLEGAPVQLLDQLERLSIIEPTLGDERPRFAALGRAKMPKLRALHLLGRFWDDASGVAKLAQLPQLAELVVETIYPDRWRGLAGRVQLLKPK